MIGAAFTFAARLDESYLHQALKYRPSIGFRSLDESGRVWCCNVSPAPEFIEHEKIFQTQWKSSLIFFHNQTDKVQVGLSSEEDENHVGLGGTIVGGCRSTVTQLLEKNSVNSPPRPFHNANPLEGISQQGVTWSRRGR